MFAIIKKSLIKKNYLNKLQRFKLNEEISKFLDMVCLIICIIYSLSNIKYNYIKSIEQQLFKPWNLKVSQKFKECGDMIRLPFIDIEDIDEPETDLKDVVKQANSRKEQEKETNKGDEPAAGPGETTPGAEDTDNDVDADFTDTDKVD